LEVAVQAVTAAIALAALAVSICVARRQTRIQEQQTGIQERLAAIEEARRGEELEARGRARVTASIRHEEGRYSRRSRLVLVNEGPAVARRVTAAVEEPAQAPGVLGLDALPVDLQAGQEMPFGVTVGLGDRMAFRVVVRWADAAGDHEAPYTLPLY
jgi:hypothetical protein